MIRTVESNGSNVKGLGNVEDLSRKSGVVVDLHIRVKKVTT